VGIVRTEPEMQQAVVEIERLKQQLPRIGVAGGREYHSGWHTAIDMRNLVVVSEAIALSAIERKESRGGHFRDDYPEKDPKFATFNIATRRGPDGSMQVTHVPLPPMPEYLKEVIEEQKS
jgi:succinate dehydrogenase / fumarate reductase, flavoprotein subunit